MKIINTHECFWANQHQAITIVEYKKEGWTLFADHSKMEHELEDGTEYEEDEDTDMEYRLSIDYCPFCGDKLSKHI
jgi:hypothetical protein